MHAMGPQRAPLSEGRWHWSHGPIDLVIGAEGSPAVVQAALSEAWVRFGQVLPELVAELALLRRPVGERCTLQGAVARRMWAACAPFRGDVHGLQRREAGLRPMAAVAGAVAQEVLALLARGGIERAWVNNGGDIALHLAPGAQVRIGLVSDLARALRPGSGGEAITDGRFEIDAASPVRGIATSGWRGRSLSLGIADSVTVLATTAAQADAAATSIANAVDTDDPRIARRPACELRDDTDLGTLPATVHVPVLEPAVIARALQAGLRHARALQARGLIHAAFLVCQGQATSTEGGRPWPPAPLAFPRMDARLPDGSVFA